jgi:predicted metal-dependent hydrolase
MATMNTTSPQHSPLIVAFVGDLMWSTKIGNVARRLGYRIILIETAADVGGEQAHEQQNLPGEAVFGLEAALVDKITEWQPSLLIFDLDSNEIPWRRWIALLKSSPATRQMPVLGFAPHEDIEVIAAARELSTDVVVGRSRFSSALPNLIEETARVWDYEAIALGCQAPLSELALEGLEEFNRRDYFESHEHLEDAWNEDESAARDVYKAVLQVAIAYLQIERENYAGAVKMFLRARQWLQPLPGNCRGIDISQLSADAQSAYLALTELGPNGIGNFDRSLLRPVIFTPGLHN